MAYQYNSRKAKPLPAFFLTSFDRESFWNLVNRSAGQGPQGLCWQWTGAAFQNDRGTDGYGRLTVQGLVYRAHRVAYMLAYGENPGHQMVLHSCDNPPCVRPEHLSLGDAQKNRRDTMARGRQGKGLNAGPATRSVF